MLLHGVSSAKNEGTQPPNSRRWLPTLKANGIPSKPVNRLKEVAVTTELSEQTLNFTKRLKQRLTGVGIKGGLLAVLALIALIAIAVRDSDDNRLRKDDRAAIELLTLAHERHNGMILISGTIRGLESSLKAPFSVLATAFNADGAIVASSRGHQP